MSNAVGSYLRHVQNPADEDPVNDGARRSLDGLGPSKPQLTAEQVKQAYEDAVLADEKRSTINQNADEFLLLHPEILDTKKNAELINKMLKQRFGDVAYTVAHFEDVTQSLLITDSLDINKAEVVRQQQQAADAKRQAAVQRRADAAARAFNPDADYEEMSLEELRNRANEELQLGGQQEGAAGF